MLSVLLYKSHIWGNSCSWDIVGKAFNQLDCRILYHIISPDGMPGTHWFFTCRQVVRRGKKLIKFFIGFLHRRPPNSCSATENKEKWKIKWKEEVFHAFLIHNLSRQSLLSKQIAVFIDQLEIYKDHCFSFLFLHVGRTSDEESIKGKWDFGTSWNWC